MWSWVEDKCRTVVRRHIHDRCVHHRVIVHLCLFVCFVFVCICCRRGVIEEDEARTVADIVVNKGVEWCRFHLNAVAFAEGGDMVWEAIFYC